MASSPSIFVTDSTIWIDASHGRVIPHLFTLPFRFITTDFIYDALHLPAGTDLLSRGLETHALTPKLIFEMLEMIHRYPRSSRIDISALILARHLKLPLLSGDETLRTATGREGIRLHGTLYLLDQMVAQGVIIPEEAGKALGHMLVCRSRLPENECRKRFEGWTYRTSNHLTNDVKFISRHS